MGNNDSGICEPENGRKEKKIMSMECRTDELIDVEESERVNA